MNYTYYRRYQAKPRHSSFRSFFWFVVIVLVSLALIQIGLSFIRSLNEEKRDEAVLSVYRGEVEHLEWGETQADLASDAELFLVGDQVETAEDSYAQLRLFNGSLLYLDEETVLKYADFASTEQQDRMVLDLLKGRVWVEQDLSGASDLALELRTDLMNVEALYGKTVVGHLGSQEYVWCLEGQVSASYMDRGTQDQVIETALLSEGEQSVFDSEKAEALLDRENLTLVETLVLENENDFFLNWAGGEVATVFASTEPPAGDTHDLEEELEEVDSDQSLNIRIVSPVSGSTVQKDAIALEGEVVSGTAVRIVVTWLGNGTPYELGLFEPGASSFRYVADVDYANYSKGENTYSVVAYDMDGKPSNTVTLSFTAEF